MSAKMKRREVITVLAGGAALSQTLPDRLIEQTTP
jgi:hypothetical protein